MIEAIEFLPELASGRGTAPRSGVVEGKTGLRIAPPPGFAWSPSPSKLGEE
jgi:hypothetical protein